MKKPCLKCLLSEMDPDEELRSILEYIKKIPEYRKTSDEEYSRRLNICRSCESLMNGICGKCGCFVELRAAKKEMYCPSEEKKW